MMIAYSFLLCSVLLLGPGSGQQHLDVPDDKDAVEDLDVIKLAGIYDTTVYDWAPDIFEVTVDLINREWQATTTSTNSNNNRPRLEYALENSNCDETAAARSYWKLRSANGDKPFDGIVGARCSGATISLARISGLEAVRHLTPASNSPQLSDTTEFPFFSRMVAPNDERGEVGATIAMLRAFGWSRITILNTDTVFAKDWVTAFRKAWVGDWHGEVAYSDTIRLSSDGVITREAIRHSLSGIPTDDPTVNSRIILLAAHSQHAMKILEEAAHQDFQGDTVWIGGSSWAPHYDNPKDLFWMKDPPGYLAAVPFRNRDAQYTDFLDELQAWRRQQGKPVTIELPAFARETVDAIRALSTALVAVPNKRDGDSVVRVLRNLEFDGVSGRVSFNDLGDRENPMYSIFNARSVTDEGTIVWEEIGIAGTQVGSVEFWSDVCFPEVGCVPVAEAPSDSYPEPPLPVPLWMALLVAIIAMLLIGLAIRYERSKKGKIRIAAELNALRQSVAGMRTATCTYIPRITTRDDNDDGGIKQTLDESLSFRGETAKWMWQESQGFMDKHDANQIHDLSNCWVLYGEASTAKLEKAFQEGKGKAKPLPGYEVTFASMQQTKLASGFSRRVKRILLKDDVVVGDTFPADLEGEPRVILIKGDVLQVSKQRTTDNWVFGKKLHYANESIARQMVGVACNGLDAESVNVFPDSGWFQLDKTRLPTAEDLKFLKDTVDGDALACPKFWAKVEDPSVVERHVLPPSTERTEVERAFLSTLDQSRTDVVKVERIQNLAMWQSYVVKRQTICNREIIKSAAGDPSDDSLQKAALDRYEKRWLFHGTNVEVMNCILEQGFNRSFCGKNATLWGKGVYYARDASFSACTTYAKADRNGFQYIMACRVVVGEYCLGKRNAPTPDVRDAGTLTLYDATVDNMDDPEVFVTYHDAQAYPEYLKST